MKAVTIKGIALMKVDKYGIYLNGEDIRDFLREALQPTEKELESYEKIPANIVIQIEPIQTKLEIEHPGEPKLMDPFEVEMRKAS